MAQTTAPDEFQVTEAGMRAVLETVARMDEGMRDLALMVEVQGEMLAILGERLGTLEALQAA